MLWLWNNVFVNKNFSLKQITCVKYYVKRLANWQWKNWFMINTEDVVTLSTCGLVDQFITSLKKVDDYNKVFQQMLKVTPMYEYWRSMQLLSLQTSRDGITPNVLWPILEYHWPSFHIKGPFHVYLNIIDDHIMLSRFFYAPLFKFYF